MKFSTNLFNKFLFILTSLCLVLATFAVFSTESWVYAFFFNSDALYLPTLFQGLLVEGYPLSSWYLNPSLLLIPDIVVFFVIHAISGNAIISMFTFGIIQHLLIFIAMIIIFNQLFKKESWFFASVSGLLMLLFFLGTILSNDFIFAAFGLGSTIHTGAFVMAMLCVGLTLHYFNFPKKSTIIWLFILAMLSVISDRLFILMYAIPVSGISLFLLIKYRKKVPLVLFLTSTLSLLLGMWLHNYLDGKFFHLLKLPEITDYSKIIPSFLLLMEHMKIHLLAFNAHSIIITLSVVSFIFHILIFFILVKNNEFYSTISFYALYSIIFIPAIFLMPVLTGNYTGIDTLRYNIGAMYLAILNVGFLLGYFFYNKRFSIVALPVLKGIFVVGLVVMFGIGFTHLSKKGLTEFFGYYPSFVKELDEISEHENLKYGAANFWYAKPITVFSKKGLKVYHTFDPIVPFYHSTTKMWYIDTTHVFNYAVISSFDDKDSYFEYLPRKGRIVKNGNTEILILPDFKFSTTNGLPYFIEPDTLNPEKVEIAE